MKSNVIIGVLFLALVGLLGFVFTRPTPMAPVGAAAGNDFYNFTNFFGGMTVGQGSAASSTVQSTATLAGSEFVNADTLAYTINVGSVTLTLPASTTPMCASIPKGQRRTLVFRNATTTATSILTMAGGTGFTLVTASTTNAIDGSTTGRGQGILTVTRLPNTDCVGSMVTSL